MRRAPEPIGMQGSKLVVLVPDSATRDRARAVCLAAPIAGLHASLYVAHDGVEACVRDTRRSLFDGPLAVLTHDHETGLLALAAGADEAFSLDSFVLDETSWVRLVERARLKSEGRHGIAQRLASLAELERVCALGRLVSGVADELTGPLHNALLSLQMLKRELDPMYQSVAQLRALCASEQPLERAALAAALGLARGTGSTTARALDVLADVTDTCEAVAQVASELDLRDLGLRAPQLGEALHERHEYIDLRDTLDKILRLFRRSAAKSTHIDRDYADDLPEVLAPRGRIAQVLISLLANSLASLRGAPHEVHRLRISVRADDALVTVTVSDTGPGLCSEALELAVARSIMRALGGDLSVESRPGAGATCVACLPRPKQREERPSGTVPKPDFARALPHETGQHGGKPEDRAAKRRTVLVLEPDRNVLSALSHLLRERYEVLLALSGDEARSVIASGTKPDAVLAAVDDPESRRFVEWLLLERADLARRLVLTTDMGEPGDDLLGLPWLEKPLATAPLFRGIEGRFVAPLRKARTACATQPRLAKRG